MPNANEQKNFDKAHRTLVAIQQHGFEDAIIAGGAVRDRYFDIPFRDIDIYVQAKYRYTVKDPKYNAIPSEQAYHVSPISDKQKHNVLKELVGDSFVSPVRDMNQKFGSYYEDSNGVVAVWQFIKQGIVYQLIFTNVPPRDFVKDCFDFNICKCYYDGKDFHYLPEFLADVKNHTLTLSVTTLTDNMMCRVLKDHFQRISRKFPNFQLATVPENNEQVARCSTGPTIDTEDDVIDGDECEKCGARRNGQC